MEESITDLVNLANENSGFLSLLIFIATILLGWVSGLFKKLFSKHKLDIDIIDGPTMVSCFETGREYEGNKTHRTVISLYLEITNKGSTPTDIMNVEVGYHNYTFKYTFFWFWLSHSYVSLSDFKVKIGDHTKFYPFLFQKSYTTGEQADTYLKVGKKTSGIVYFEQGESWGGFQPKDKDGNVTIKIRVTDSFGRKYVHKTKIPLLSIKEARNFNPEFGNSLEALRQQTPNNAH